jgi:hypothetical protein
LIPPDPRNWWDLWWNHLIPRTSPNFHVWQYIGGSLWNHRNSIVEHTAKAISAPLMRWAVRVTFATTRTRPHAPRPAARHGPTYMPTQAHAPLRACPLTASSQLLMRVCAFVCSICTLPKATTMVPSRSRACRGPLQQLHLPLHIHRLSRRQLQTRRTTRGETSSIEAIQPTD